MTRWEMRMHIKDVNPNLEGEEVEVSTMEVLDSRPMALMKSLFLQRNFSTSCSLVRLLEEVGKDRDRIHFNSNKGRGSKGGKGSSSRMIQNLLSSDSLRQCLSLFSLLYYQAHCLLVLLQMAATTHILFRELTLTRMIW